MYNVLQLKEDMFARTEVSEHLEAIRREGQPEAVAPEPVVTASQEATDPRDPEAEGHGGGGGMDYTAIRYLVEGAPLPCAEVLLPQSRIGLDRATGPQGL